MLPDTRVDYHPQVHPRGHPRPKFLIVGEAPGKNEVDAGVPFVGASGQELMRMLAEAGISEAQCAFTNVVNIRPPNNSIARFFATSKKKAAESGCLPYAGKYALPIVYEGIRALRQEIINRKPEVVIGCGNTALWACTGEWGIMKWRGSQMEGNIDGHKFKFIPVVHPAAILRSWAWRWFTVVDLRRSAGPWRMPDYAFTVRPSFDTVMDTLGGLLRIVEQQPYAIAVDLETRVRHIACLGLAWSSRHALCIPFMCVEDEEGYWSFEQEVQIWDKLRELLTHPNCRVIGQNFAYDNQYLIRRVGFAANLADDTMFQMHVCFPGTKKSLDFISSIFCEYHSFWKEEGKEWEKNMDEDQLWVYNCKDAVTTYEVNEALHGLLHKFQLQEQYHERMQVQRVALRMMLRGVSTDQSYKRQLSRACQEAITQRRDFLLDVVGYDVFGPKGISAQKMKKLCYEILQLPPKYRIDPATKRRVLTCNKDAIDEWITSCNLFFRPILHTIKETRSLMVFKSTFADAAVDWDDRFRCSFNVAGPHTFRWSSSEDAFKFGTNMQNIPKGDER